MASIGTTELTTLIEHMWQLSRVGRYCPIMIWGEAGVGKSETVRAAASKLGIDFIDLRLGNFDAPDLMGMMRDDVVYPSLFDLLDDREEYNPLATGERFSRTGLWHHAKLKHPDKIPAEFQDKPIEFTEWMIHKLEQAGYGVYFETRTVYSAPMWFPEPDSAGIVFLDELNRSQSETRQGVFQLLLDRRIHELVLPPGWIIVSANNPPIESVGDQVTGYDVDDLTDRALLARFCHTVLTTTREEWLDYAAKAGVDPSIRVLIESDASSKLLGLKTGLSIPSMEPTPRSWVLLSNVLGPVQIEGERERQLSGRLVEVVAEGILGEKIGREYYSFIQDYEMSGAERWQSKDLREIESNELPLFEVRLEEITDLVRTNPDVATAQVAARSIKALLAAGMHDVASKYLPIWRSGAFLSSLAAVRDPSLADAVSFMSQWYGSPE